jgi:hypothetical protein
MPVRNHYRDTRSQVGSSTKIFEVFYMEILYSHIFSLDAKPSCLCDFNGINFANVVKATVISSMQSLTRDKNSQIRLVAIADDSPCEHSIELRTMNADTIQQTTPTERTYL